MAFIEAVSKLIGEAAAVPQSMIPAAGELILSLAFAASKSRAVWSGCLRMPLKSSPTPLRSQP